MIAEPVLILFKTLSGDSKDPFSSPLGKKRAAAIAEALEVDPDDVLRQDPACLRDWANASLFALSQGNAEVLRLKQGASTSLSALKAFLVKLRKKHFAPPAAWTPVLPFDIIDTVQLPPSLRPLAALLTPAMDVKPRAVRQVALECVRQLTKEREADSARAAKEEQAGTYAQWRASQPLGYPQLLNRAFANIRANLVGLHLTLEKVDTLKNADRKAKKQAKLEAREQAIVLLDASCRFMHPARLAINDIVRSVRRLEGVRRAQEPGRH